MLDELWVQAQCSDPIKCPTLSTTYDARVPKYPSAGWIIVYPQEGKLESRPNKEEALALDYVVEYFPIASPGNVYHKATHSADAIAQFVVKGDTEEEASKNLIKAMDWFHGKCTWTTEN